MNKKTFPVEEIIPLINKGLSIEKIAQHFNTSRPTMGKFLKENGLKTKQVKNNERCKELDINRIIQEYQDGKSSYKIAEENGVNQCAIIDRLKKNNIHIRDKSECKKIYHENQHYFDEINSYDKAYLLGFLCADGFVTDRNEVGIGVSKKDEEIVYWFKNQLQSDKPIKYISSTNAVELRIQNKYLAEKLISYGVVPRKSLVLDIGDVIKYSNLKAEYIPSFLLGYYDGDGGIYECHMYNKYYIYNCSVTGTFETCSYYKQFFNGVGCFTKRHKDDKNNYTYQIGGRNKVREALSKLYAIKDNLSFFYKRKYERYCRL